MAVLKVYYCSIVNFSGSLIGQIYQEDSLANYGRVTKNLNSSTHKEHRVVP